MTKPAAFKASYADWKLVKTRACVQIIFEIPVEKANEAYEVLGGMPFAATESWFAIARLKQQQEETTTATEKPAPATPAARAPRNRLTTKAGILSADPLFHRYLAETYPGHAYGKDEAADYIRTTCGVGSRKDIQPGTEAAIELDFIESKFVAWRDHDRFIEAP